MGIYPSIHIYIDTNVFSAYLGLSLYQSRTLLEKEAMGNFGCSFNGLPLNLMSLM